MTLTVTQLTNYIKSSLEQDRNLMKITVTGELSNYKIHSAGHHYFTLKDDGAVISCVMFRSDASRIRFTPENGLKVVLSGRIGVFAKSGQYQIYVSDMQPDGIGALYMAFEQLKEKLGNEGLFDKSNKKPIPKYPKRIALVTSPTGAAVRDMIQILGRRWPLADVLVCPVLVQGTDAAPSIAAMIKRVDEAGLADVIIVGRGGGSIEDLWAFNEEITARAIFACRTPIISAVGHEPDFTISDFVADVRAATPSNAAELAVRDRDEVLGELEGYRTAMYSAMQKKLKLMHAKLDSVASRKIMSSPYEYLNERKMLVNLFQTRIISAEEKIISSKQREFSSLAASLDAMSPLKVLSRGYSAVRSGSRVITSAAQLKTGQELTIAFSDGEAECAVQKIKITE